MVLPSSSSETPKMLSQVVHEYHGYDSSARRKNSDQQIRLCMIEKIDEILQQLNGLPAAHVDEDKRRLTDLSQSTRRKLSTISQSLRAPTYAGKSFFSLEKISDKRLENIYKRETAMLGGLSGIAEELAALMQQKMEKTFFEDHFLHIADFIDNFNQALFEREALILGDQF